MAEWIEIAAARVLVVARHEMLAEFDVYDAEGNQIVGPEAPLYRAVRRRDGRVFKPAALVPVERYQVGNAYLQEA